ncbi:hypothetical protein [Mycobacterium malmoense]|uniref:hypothetical protein n=1 Tax=Mycobacterium malmoense TaxID=1780 RepID=UPI001131F562|nr:hypothetical protein [Mycobacterium malmoense]
MRARRVSIPGFPEEHGWEANELGIIYRHDHIQPITNLICGLPTVDVGPHYFGPVPRPGDAEDCKNLRLLEELVCHAFHRSPPNWRCAQALHANGDDGDCTAANLSWAQTDPEYAEWQGELACRALMRAANLRPSKIYGIAGSSTNLITHKIGRMEPLHTDCPNLPGHLPKLPERKTA